MQTISNAYPRFTNLDSGNSIVWHSSYVATDTYYPDENVGTFDVNGRFFVTFFPGDVAFGEVVGDDGVMLGIKGHLQVTYSLDTFAVTSSSLDGSVVADLCALLA